MGSTSSSREMSEAQSERILERLDTPDLEKKIRIFDDEEELEETQKEDSKKRQKEVGAKR